MAETSEIRPPRPNSPGNRPCDSPAAGFPVEYPGGLDAEANFPWNAPGGFPGNLLEVGRGSQVSGELPGESPWGFGG